MLLPVLLLAIQYVSAIPLIDPLAVRTLCNPFISKDRWVVKITFSGRQAKENSFPSLRFARTISCVTSKPSNVATAKGSGS